MRIPLAEPWHYQSTSSIIWEKPMMSSKQQGQWAPVQSDTLSAGKSLTSHFNLNHPVPMRAAPCASDFHNGDRGRKEGLGEVVIGMSTLRRCRLTSDGKQSNTLASLSPFCAINV